MGTQIKTAAIVLMGAWGGMVQAQTASPQTTLSMAASAGFRIMTDRGLGNCVACHAIPGQTGIPSTFGPSLDGVGLRYDGPALKQWVFDARQLKPDTLMPPFGTTQGTRAPHSTQPMLNTVDIDLVVAALQSLR